MVKNCNSSYLVDSLEPLYCDTEDWILVLQAVFLAVVIVSSIIGNVFILFLVFKYKVLRYRSILVSLSAVICDLTMVFFFQIPALISVSAKGWVLGYEGCQFVGYVGFHLIYVRWMTMAVISLDRFSYIFFPLSYPRRSKPVLIIMTIAAWTVPFFMHAPIIFGIGRYTFKPGYSQCVVDCGTNRTCYGMYVAIFSIQVFVGAILPCVLYTIMYIYSCTKRQKIQLGSYPGLDIAENQVPHWSKRDLRALTTFVLVLLALLLSNMPIYAVSIMRRSFPDTYENIPFWMHMLTIDLFYFTGVLDPLLIIRNRDFYRATLSLCQCSKFHHLHSTMKAASLIHLGNNGGTQV